MTEIKKDAEENRSLQSGLCMGSIASSSFQSSVFTSCEKTLTGFQLCYKQYTVLYIEQELALIGNMAEKSLEHSTSIRFLYYSLRDLSFRCRTPFCSHCAFSIILFITQENSLFSKFFFFFLHGLWRANTMILFPSSLLCFSGSTYQYLPTDYPMDNKQKPNNKQENGCTAALFITI